MNGAIGLASPVPPETRASWFDAKGGGPGTGFHFTALFLPCAAAAEASAGQSGGASTEPQAPQATRALRVLVAEDNLVNRYTVTLETSTAAADYKTLGSITHSLKGTLATFGAWRSSKACEALERMLLRNEIEGLDAALRKLLHELSQLRPLLEEAAGAAEGFSPVTTPRAAS